MPALSLPSAPRLLLPALLVLLLSCAACSQRAFDPAGSDPPRPEPRDMIRGELLAEIDAWNGAGFDAAVAEQLRRSMRVVVESDARQRYTSKAPGGQVNTITDLSLSGSAEARTLTWSYRNVGDYDRNSEVNIADLSAIGLHFQKTTASPDWQAAQAADGDENGEVNVADVTPIGANIFSQFDRYRVLAAVDGESELLPIGEVLFADGDAGAQGGFQFTVPAAGGYKVFAVEPLDSSGAAGQRSILVGEGIVFAQIPGPPGAKVNSSLPQITFPGIADADMLPFEQVNLAADRIVVVFDDAATVSDANTLLTQLGAKLGGSCPPIEVAVLLLDTPAATTDELGALLDTARLSPAVELASADIGTMVELSLPPYGPLNQYTLARTFPAISRDGTGWSWGLENVRAPQAWNLREYALRAGTRGDVFLIDGFKDSDPDLRDRVHYMVPPAGSNLHGMQVMRTIGATWGNQLIHEAINPLSPEFYSYDLHTINNASNFYDQQFCALMLPILFDQGLKQHPSVVVVNMSFGFLGGSLSHAVWLDPLGAIYNSASETFSAKVRSNYLICSAAGYDGDKTGALLPMDSVANNVAIKFPDGHFISVEATTDVDKYEYEALKINLGGTVSSPGHKQPYTGTSFATPMVSSLVSYVWSLKPSLDWRAVKDLVAGAGYTHATTGGTKPRIDAYSAVMGIDLHPIGFTMQKAMVDVDDGTPDGQLRTDPFGGAVFGQIDTPDGMRGDGLVTMRDLRCWRDAFVQLQTAGPLADKKLDGPTQHFKKDLNMDGLIGQTVVSPPHAYPWTNQADLSKAPPSENAYPRCDFNGDGQIDMQFRSVNGLDHRDVDMLADNQFWQAEEVNAYREGVYADPALEGTTVGADVWAPARYVLANRDAAWEDAPAELKELPDYLHSFDMHVQLDYSEVDPGVDGFEITVEAEQWPDGLDNNGTAGVDEAFEQVFARKATFTRESAMPVVVTLPLWTGMARVRWKGFGDSQPEGQAVYGNLKFGQDKAVTVPTSWSIQPIGARPDALAIVDGRPAVIYKLPGNVINYMRASDEWGTSWDTPVTITDIETNDGAFYSFDVIAGRPTAVTVNVNFDTNFYGDYELRLHRAGDIDGATWPPPLVLKTGDWAAFDGQNSFLALTGITMIPVDNGAAIAYSHAEKIGDVISHTLEYMYSSDGTLFGGAQTVATGSLKSVGALGLVNGNPGIVYADLGENPTGTYYTAGSGVAGGGWSAPHPLGIALAVRDLIDVGGFPGVLAFAGTGTLNFYRGLDAGGNQWDNGFTFDSGLNFQANQKIGLALIDGNPVTAYTGPDYADERYLRAVDPLGDVWPVLEEKVDHDVNNGSTGGVVDFDGRPAFWYIDDGVAYVAIHQ